MWLRQPTIDYLKELHQKKMEHHSKTWKLEPVREELKGIITTEILEQAMPALNLGEKLFLMNMYRIDFLYEDDKGKTFLYPVDWIPQTVASEQQTKRWGFALPEDPFRKDTPEETWANLKEHYFDIPYVAPFIPERRELVTPEEFAKYIFGIQTELLLGGIDLCGTAEHLAAVAELHEKHPEYPDFLILPLDIQADLMDELLAIRERNFRLSEEENTRKIQSTDTKEEKIDIDSIDLSTLLDL